MALSSDYVIGVAPGISAKAAGAAVSAVVVADRALVLSLITGGIALILGYLSIRRLILPANPALLDQWHEAAASGVMSSEKFGTFDKSEMVHWVDKDPKSANMANKNTAAFGPHGRFAKWSRIFAILTPLTFLGVVLVMVLPKLGTGLPELKGGDAAALVGGVAALLMMLATLAAEGPRKMLSVCPEHITDGLVFAFKAMGSVLPIAGFFFLGAGETAAQILGVPADKAPSLLFELVQAGQGLIPNNGVLVAFGVLIVGMITGIDGSGFAGLPLTGALSGALAPVVGMDAATLAAVGQMGAVWTGGGTLIAWSSLIAVTGFARVPVMEAVRLLFFPVITGLAASTICAVLLWR